MTEIAKGWAYPTRKARKAHYFPGRTRSLCGKYSNMFLAPSTHSPDIGKSKDDCVACRRRLDAS